MKTEEIIIDGVNVAGCRFFQDGMCYAEKDNEGYTDIECNYDNYDCYFKQLERIKPENKALYVLKNSLCKMIDEDSEKIKRLEQENKDLKKQIESDKGLITVGGKQQYQYLRRIDELEQENKELKELKCKFKEYCTCDTEKYRSVLEEIREKVKNPITLSCFASAKFVLEQIDKKINEVLNENQAN